MQGRYHPSSIESEAYYFNAVRYVESNPLRAHLVTAASDWRWSSLAEGIGHRRGILDDGPLALPPDWIRLVDESLPDPVIEEIRKSLRKH